MGLSVKKILGIITFTVLLFSAVQHISQVLAAFFSLLGLLSPVILGLCIAFILNVIMTGIEEKILGTVSDRMKRFLDKKYPKRRHFFMGTGKGRRPLALLLTFAVVIGAVFVLVFLIVPEFQRTTAMVAEVFPDFIKDLDTHINTWIGALPLPADSVPELQIDWDRITQYVSSFLQNGLGDFFSATLSITSSIFSGLFTMILGLVFSIYVLLQKEKLAKQAAMVIHAWVPERYSAIIFKVSSLSNRIFFRFVEGQFLEAIIIGCLCFLGMTVLRMPYAMVIAALVGFTALIPVFGAFIGTGIGAFLIVMVAPIKALWFVLFILVLQQVEGNLIYPKVVGSSIGLPGIWVLVAVTIGGSSFGILGMLIGVPLSSVIYALFREAVYKRLAEKDQLNET